ncbi:hypothetical protein ACHAP8_004657 [Fusarium lateritium]
MKGGRKVHKAFVRRGASWRTMLVAQPPITSVGYIHRVNWAREQRLLSFPEGLRMGELYDMVFQAIWSRPDDISGCLYVELGLNGFLDETARGMLNEWGKIPPLMVESIEIVGKADVAATPCGNKIVERREEEYQNMQVDSLDV